MKDAIYPSPIRWDAHGCPPLKVGGDLSFLHRYKNSGINFLSLNVGFDLMTQEDSLALINYFYKWIAEHKDEFCIVKKVRDIYESYSNNKLSIGFDIEGATILNGNLEMINDLYNLGVRQFLFAYNRNNAYAGGCLDNDPGLSVLGKKLVRMCNEVGMVIDCSHVGFKTSMEIMELSSAPVVFSHSNPIGMADHPRNISDTQINACGMINGVIGINGVGLFLGNNNVKSEKIVEHIDYIVQKIGPDHVGLGLDCAFDFDEINELIKNNPDSFPKEAGSIGTAVAQPEQFLEIATLLIENGYPKDAINKILGENFLRIADTVWK